MERRIARSDLTGLIPGKIMARICMIAFTHYPTDTRICREAEALVERGDDVEVISLRQMRHGRTRAQKGVQIIQVPMGQYHGSIALLYLASYILFFVIAFLVLTARHLSRPFHIIQVHTLPDFMVFVAIVPRVLGAKIILDIHDLMPELYQSKFGYGEQHWMIRFVAWVERQSVGFADRAIAVHRPHLDALVDRGNDEQKFIILLNVPDPRIFPLRRREQQVNHDSLRLIYHGTVARRHGLSMAVRAVDALRDEINGLELRIIGDGDGITDITNLVRKLELSTYVRLDRGFFQIEEIIPSLLQSNVGIVPTLYDEFTRFMLPTKLLEYVAMGIPTICSRTETIETYFDDSMVQYFESGDLEDLIEKIRYLHHHPDRRAEIAMHADRFNRDFTWSRQKELYYELVDTLLEPKQISAS